MQQMCATSTVHSQNYECVIQQSGRLDVCVYMALHEHGLSREKVKKAIHGGLCRVDGLICLKPSSQVLQGQTVHYELLSTATELVADPRDLPIVYRDQWLALVNKPAGLPVHPAPSCQIPTLVHRLLHHFPELSSLEGQRPGIVHRLDQDTSGLVLVALDEQTRAKLSAAFAARQVTKWYLALVAGVIAPQGVCTEPLGRHPLHKTRMAVIARGRAAHTEWRCLYSAPDKSYSLVAVHILTGRTHQIRVHMAHLGHPLLGDKTYADAQTAERAARQMLHAWKLAFTHPRSEELMSFRCIPPTDFIETAALGAQQNPCIVVTGLAGSGKSFCTQHLGVLGARTWSADAVVKNLYAWNAHGWHLLDRHYAGRFTPHGQAVDKAALGLAMQQDADLKKGIETLIHPLVLHSLREFLTDAQKRPGQMSVAEVPLWFESGFAQEYRDLLVIGVSCETSVRHSRLTQRGWSQSTIDKADAWQWNEPAKLAGCDYVIDNSAGLQEFIQKIESTVDHIQQLHKSRKEKHMSWLLNVFENA